VKEETEKAILVSPEKNNLHQQANQPASRSEEQRPSFLYTYKEKAAPLYYHLPSCLVSGYHNN